MAARAGACSNAGPGALNPSAATASLQVSTGVRAAPGGPGVISSAVASIKVALSTALHLDRLVRVYCTYCGYARRRTPAPIEVYCASSLPTITRTGSVMLRHPGAIFPELHAPTVYSPATSTPRDQPVD